jgi:hypothetical protein
MTLTSCDFILLILNCKKYQFKALKQKELWLSHFTLMPYFHVIGDPDLKTKYNFDHENHLLYVKTPDDYNSLPQKVIAAYSAINDEYIFEYIFKTDDDQQLSNILFLKTIQSLLKQKIPKIHYAGNIVDVLNPYISQYHLIHPELPENLPILKTRYCSGRFYVLSALAIQQLIAKTNEISKEFLEDYAIGYHLNPILKKNMLHIDTNKYFTDIT